MNILELTVTVLFVFSGAGSNERQAMDQAFRMAKDEGYPIQLTPFACKWDEKTVYCEAKFGTIEKPQIPFPACKDCN